LKNNNFKIEKDRLMEVNIIIGLPNQFQC